MRIRFYFDFISPYAYLAYHGVQPIAERHDAVIEPVPILFAALLNHHGQKGPAEIPAKRVYVFKDVVRSAAKLGIPLEPPPSHPFNPLAALRLCSLDVDEDIRWKLIGEVFDLVWAGNGGATEQNLTRVAADFGIEDAAEQIARPEIKERVKLDTSRAIEAGAFGVPTMVVDEELFWGYDSLDHLDDFLGGADPIPEDLVERWAHIQASATR